MEVSGKTGNCSITGAHCLLSKTLPFSDDFDGYENRSYEVVQIRRPIPELFDYLNRLICALCTCSQIENLE